MIVLSNGYKLPETGDFGSVWFPALEDNITRLNGHTHDGSNSEKLPSTSIQNSTITIATGDWVDQGNGYHRYTFTLPGSALYDEKIPILRLDSDGDTVYARFEKLSTTQGYVYVNTPDDYTLHLL